jgi:hypothetical protein
MPLMSKKHHQFLPTPKRNCPPFCARTKPINTLINTTARIFLEFSIPRGWLPYSVHGTLLKQKKKKCTILIMSKDPFKYPFSKNPLNPGRIAKRFQNRTLRLSSDALPGCSHLWTNVMACYDDHNWKVAPCASALRDLEVCMAGTVIFQFQIYS